VKAVDLTNLLWRLLVVALVYLGLLGQEQEHP